MTKKHDWTKLTNGWVRENYCLRKDDPLGYVIVRVFDLGDVEMYSLLSPSPERTLELLTEAVAQRKQCEVREPRFRFGDWVKTPLGSRHRVVDVRRGGVCYTLPLGGISLYAYDESELTPCDPPGDGGGE